MRTELWRLRKAVKASQSELSRRAGIPKAIISMSESRGLKLKPEQEVKIRAALLAIAKDRSDSCARATAALEAEPACVLMS